MDRLSRFGWYPLLLALAWLLQAYSIARAEPPAAVRTFVAVAAVALLTTAIGIRLLGRERGSLASAIGLVGLIAARSPLYALPFVAGVLLLFVERRWSAQGRIHLPWRRIHEALSVFVLALFLVQVAQLATRSDPTPEVASTAWAGQVLNAEPRPNMYLLLVDAHGRRDILRDRYQYDDQAFLDSLEADGFDVAAASHSNYALTRFSLGSMLSASYLDRLNDDPSTTAEDDLARRTIHDNPAFPLLRRAGYGVTVVSSGYEHLGLRSADSFVDSGQLNEFETAISETVATSGLWTTLDPDGPYEMIRDRVRDELATVVDLAANQGGGSRFVFAHLPVPHSPYIFSDDCGRTTPIETPPEGIGRGGGSPAVVAAVAAQTRCIDRLVGEAVTSIAKLDPTAVIVVFSDHGPDAHLDWSRPDPHTVEERSANLFAARTPGRSGLFPDDVTLVNVLPILLNSYLGTDLAVHPNEFWFGPRPQDRTFVRIDPEPAGD